MLEIKKARCLYIEPSLFCKHVSIFNNGVPNEEDVDSADFAGARC